MHSHHSNTDDVMSMPYRFCCRCRAKTEMSSLRLCECTQFA